MSQIDAAIDCNASHHRARNLTRYASKAPLPLVWWKVDDLRPQEDEGSRICWRCWQQGYGTQWGFDGELTNDLDVLQLQEVVLLELVKCESTLLGVESGIQETNDVLKGLCKKAWSEILARKAGCLDRPRCSLLCPDEVEDVLLNIIELYDQ